MDTPESFRVLPSMTVSVNPNLHLISDLVSSEFIVPVESVFAAQDVALNSTQRFVWLLAADSMTVSRKPVVVGNLSSFGIEITSGVKEGDQIIAAGVHFLTEGQKVRKWQREKGL